jgi:hypothetical protein
MDYCKSVLMVFDPSFSYQA